MAVAGFVSKTKTRNAPDPILSRMQLQALQEWWRDWGPERFSRHFVSVLAKKAIAPKKEGDRIANRRLVPFIYNRMQRDMSRTYAQRNDTLKMRQGGATTWHCVERIFLPTILNPGTFSVVVGQTHTYSRIYFAIINRARRHFARGGFIDGPEHNEWAESLQKNLLHTVYSSKRELVFDFLESQVFVDSSENEEVGQGLPGVSHLLCTELSRWRHNPEETMANLTESVHPGGTIDLEATANGMGGFFFEEWMRSKNWPHATYKPHFYPWWWTEEYTQEAIPADEDSLTEEEREKKKLFDWTLAQIAWRRDKIMALRHNFEEKYPENDMSAFLTSGGCFFDVDILRMMKTHLSSRKPLEIHGHGDYLVYKRRIPGRRYLVAFDLAEGKEIATDQNDFNAGTVIDIDTGEEMASYHSQIAPDECADEAIDIAKDYNNALIAAERNVYGGSFHLQLKHRRWARFYRHKEWVKDQRTTVQGDTKENFVLVDGFPTNTKTRPIAVNMLSKSIRETPEVWQDVGFVDEALAFVREKKTGTPRGQQGVHDDRVMCRAIARYVRAVKLNWIDPLSEEPENYGATDEDTAVGDDAALV